MSIDLEGKKILITGAGRGLGRAYALACREAGASVAVTDILEEQGRNTVEELNKGGGDSIFIPMDVLQTEAIARMGEVLEQHWGWIDGLINNAALTTGLGGKRFEDLDIETWDRVMKINVRGLWLVTRTCLPLIRKSEKGKIVNISSDTALIGADFFLHYVASKGAVIAMTRAMARELGADGIAVNAIAPGLTRVEATAGIPEPRFDYYVQGRFLKRNQMPEDLVGAAVFLLSDSASFITGQTLVVNGGYVLN